MKAQNPQARIDDLVPFGDLVGSRVNRWSGLWGQVVGPQIAANSTVAFVTREGVLVVDVDSETTGRELVARGPDVVAAWNVAAADDQRARVSSLETRIRRGSGHAPSTPAVEVRPLQPRTTCEERAEEIREGIEDPELADALVRARASWLERQALRQEADER